MPRLFSRLAPTSLVMLSALLQPALAINPPTTASPLEASSQPSAPASQAGSAQPGYNPNVFNPATGLVLDAAVSNTSLNRGNFDFRSAELNLMAAVDPFANLYAVFNATPDGVSAEEAAFMTTSLPYNLTVRGGRFFANFGRLPHWHDHELPFVDRTKSLDEFIGGESRADGVELIHLFKTPFFLQGTLGAYNKMGADNTRLEETTPAPGNGQEQGRGWESMSYLQRLFTNAELSDNVNVDLGLSNTVTPKQYYIGGVRRDGDATPRWLTGGDMTLRYEPTGANQAGRILWGTEIFRNDERRREGTSPDGSTDTYHRKYALGGYSYVDWRFANRFSGGGFIDLAEGLDHRETLTSTYGVSLNFTPSEFQRIRLQLSKVRANDGTPVDDQIFLQWFGTIGTHVHVFKDR